jgi:hypothetical protein
MYNSQVLIQESGIFFKHILNYRTSSKSTSKISEV